MATNDDYLRELQEKIRRLEFDRLPHEVATKLIEESIEKGTKLRGEFKKAENEVRNILKELLSVGEVLKTKLDKDEVNKLASIPSAGIDGSNRVKGGKLGVYYIMLVAGIAKFLEGVYDVCDVEFSDVKIEEYFDPSGEKVYAIAEDLMLELETKAIHHFVNRDAPRNKRTILLLDGPIIDPPRPPVLKGDYIKYRCKAIRSCIDRNPPVTVVGFNKRIMGNLYKNHVEELTNRKITSVYSDFNLVSLLFYNLLKEEFELYGEANSIYYTRPIKVDNIPIAKDYEKYGEIEIYSTFSVFNLRHPPFRIDIPVIAGTDISKVIELTEEIIKFVRVSTFPGLGYPIQIVTIHEKVSIRDGAAQLIYNEILTRATVTCEDVLSYLSAYLAEDY
jgi:exonuclease VII small subunit